MVKIYIRNKPLYITDKQSPEIDDYLHRPYTIFIDELNSHAVNNMLQQLEEPEVYRGVFIYPDVEKVLAAFKEHLYLIVAAGGLVQTNTREVLLIFRKGKWDLPKGKLDEGESIEECAVREIEEETGVKGLQILQPLQVTYHTYHEGDKHVLKESHWFLMTIGERSSLRPQTEEDIENCEWVRIEELSHYMNNMHASIIDVIRNTLDLLKQRA